jgi:integrase
MAKRQRYQLGSLTQKERKTGPDAWELRYYEDDGNGGRKRSAITIGTIKEYPNHSTAYVGAQKVLLELNLNAPKYAKKRVMFGEAAEFYIAKDLPDRHSTRTSYLSNLKARIRPKWDGYALDEIKAPAVEEWLKNMTATKEKDGKKYVTPLAGKTKSHIRSVMSLIYACAIRWELTDKNPIELVRVKGGTKRRRRPRIISVEEFYLLLEHLPDPYRTMVIVAMCLGLRASELFALKWGDFNFSSMTLLVVRGIVHGRADNVKTEYSQDILPLDESLAAVLLDWRARAPASGEADWLFTNADTRKPYSQDSARKDYLKPAALKAGIGNIGWHTFRHTYRAVMDETGAPITVQQKLMRHASITTTTQYGDSRIDSKREANSNVVRMVLSKPLPESPIQTQAQGAAV